MSGSGQAAGLLGRGIVSLGARFFLLACLSVILMIADQRNDHLGRFRDLLSVVVYPLQAAVDFPFSTWESMAGAMADRESLRRDNDRLELELLDARVRLQSLRALERENERLREQVRAIEDQSELYMRMAEILSVDFENRQRFIINRGDKDGVFEGQPLFDADGVVGQVVSVSTFSSEALLITDASHRIHVANERTGDRSIVQGTGDSGGLRLLSVTNEADVEVGDLLITTGYGRIFPQGRPVARISEIERQPGQSFANVGAEPVAALDRDKEVLLVWDPRMSSASGILPVGSEIIR